MHQSGFAKAPGACITDVWVHGDGKFGFLEFRTVEVRGRALHAARLALRSLCPPSRAGMQRVDGAGPVRVPGPPHQGVEAA
jgi:hypothetical protein